MEEEHEEKQKSVREKRELERKLQALSEQAPTRDRGKANNGSELNEAYITFRFAYLFLRFIGMRLGW